MVRELHTRPRAMNKFGNRGCTGESVSILWNCGLWAHHVVKSRKGIDILHDHVSKACQRIVCRLCRQQHRYQGRGMKRTIFLLVETRRTIRQSSHPSVVTEMSPTIITGSYWQSCTQRCLHKQGIITAQLSRLQERLNKTIERKMRLNTYFRGISFPRTRRAWYPWQDIM